MTARRTLLEPPLGIATGQVPEELLFAERSLPSPYVAPIIRALYP